MIDEALAMMRRMNDVFAIATILFNLGDLLAELGDHPSAARNYRESLMLPREHRFDALAAANLHGMASLAAATGCPEHAARLFGTAEAFCQTRGVQMPNAHGNVVADGECSTREMLGEARFWQARAEGAALTPEQAVTEALSVGTR